MRRAISVALLAVALVYSMYALGAVANIIIHATNPPIFDNNGQPWPIMNIVQAENYDSGGEGVAFHRAGSCGLSPGVYRTGSDWDNIVAENTQYGVGCNQVGDWQRTTVSVPTQGTQQFSLSMAVTGSSVSAHNFVWEIDTCDPTCSQLTTVSVTTGADGVFGIFQSPNFTLSAGTHVIRRFCQSGGNGFCGDVDYMQAAVGGSPTIASLSVTPTSFNIPVSPPTTIAQLSASCAGGSCAGATFAMATNGSCAGAASADNGKFTTAGNNLNVAQTIPGATPVTEHIGISVTLAGATNSGVCFAEIMQGGGIVCSVGPNYLDPVPAAAVAAFGPSPTCVANIDFRIVGGYFATLSNWLDVCNGNLFFAIPSAGRGTTPDCSQFHIISDNGTQVLDETWNPTFGAAGNQTAAFQTVNANNTAGITIKGGYYISATFRTTAASYSYSDTVNYPFVMEFWQFAKCDDGTTNCVPENDIDEIYSFPGSFGDTCGAVSCGSGDTWHQWDQGNPNDSQAFGTYSGVHGVQNGYDPTVYQTVSARLTMDGVSSSGVAPCAYLTGTRTYSTCSQFDNVTAAEFGAHMFFIFATGPQGVGGPSGNGNPPSTMDTYWQRIVIFSCPTYATTGCFNNPVLTTP